jgi:hypothetical protein
MKKLLIDKMTLVIEAHQKKKDEVIKNNLVEKYMYTGKLAKKMWNTSF